MFLYLLQPVPRDFSSKEFKMKVSARDVHKTSTRTKLEVTTVKLVQMKSPPAGKPGLQARITVRLVRTIDYC